jgi:hypothetical protein
MCPTHMPTRTAAKCARLRALVYGAPACVCAACATIIAARLLCALGDAQVIVNGLIMGLGEIAYLLLLMLLVFYFFAVIGLLFLKENDPQNFGNMCADMTDRPTRRVATLHSASRRFTIRR